MPNLDSSEKDKARVDKARVKAVALGKKQRQYNKQNFHPSRHPKTWRLARPRAAQWFGMRSSGPNGEVHVRRLDDDGQPD